MSGQRGEDEIQFCEIRIQVLHRNPNRVKALASVLSLSNVEDTRLQLWAVYELDAMRSPEADAELDRFALAVKALPETSPARQRLGLPADMVQHYQSIRRTRTNWGTKQ